MGRNVLGEVCSGHPGAERDGKLQEVPGATERGARFVQVEKQEGTPELRDENQPALGLQGSEVQREGNCPRPTRPCRSVQIHVRRVHPLFIH